MSSFNEDCRTGYETKYWKVLTKIAFSLKTKAEKKNSFLIITKHLWYNEVFRLWQPSE